MDDVERVPGLVVVAGAALVLVVCVANFAFGQVTIGIAAAIGGMLVFGAGLAWLSMERRRVRQAEREWSLDHPVANGPRSNRPVR
ncbi:LapA family protein [Mycobacterium angelicum]|nr:LapA family protein [Mycobacterium angelicum]